LQTSIHNGNEKIEAVKAEFKLEAEELNEWLRVQKEKEEDNLALVKYTKEDDARTKELTLAIEKVMGEVNKAKAYLNAEITETQIAQLELENTTAAFKDLHTERQGLISQWEEAVASMQRRDQDIDAAQDHYQSLKKEIRETLSMIKEKESIYQQQLIMNSETEKNISLTEKRIAKIRYCSYLILGSKRQ
jgi:UDP-glucose:O-linked fucose beta-1,3-glucosyltransferase